MKKGILVTVSVIIIASMLSGCTNPALPSNVAQKLEYNINSLVNTVRNLDTIDNQYLSNPDISPVIGKNALSASLQTPQKKNKNAFLTSTTSFGIIKAYALEEDETTTVNTIEKVETVNDSNVQMQTKREEVESNVVNNTSTNNEIVNDENQNIINTDSQTNVTETNSNEIVETQNTNETNLNNQDNVVTNIDVTDTTTTSTIETNNTTVNTNATDETNATNNDRNKTFFKYRPRYYENTLNNNDTTYLDNYMNKVENLYTMTNDAIEANNVLYQTKENLMQCASELKDLVVQMKRGTYVPNSQQINAINNYIADIKSTIAKIKSVNGQLNNEINKINNYDKEGLTTSIDVLNSNYLRVLNHLDVRITYLKNALSTLEQVKALLLEAQNLDNYEQNAVNYDVHYDEYINNNDRDSVNDIVNRNYVNTNETYNERIYTTRTPDENDTTNVNNENRNYVSRERFFNRFKRTNNDNLENTEIERRNRTIYNQDVLDDTNIDTYRNANIEDSYRTRKSWYDRRNIDTFNNRFPRRTVRENINNQNVNNETVKENETNNEVINNNVNTTNNNVNNATTNVNNAPAPTTTPNTANNNVVNGTVNNTGVVNNGAVNNGVAPLNPQNENAINTPNGTFQNSIITQNNLNPGVNNGVNGIRSGYSASNNNPHTVDSRGNNSNIDTYGYNTMIDIINRGTVNNGINTLSILPTNETNTKPNMVNNENNYTSTEIELPEINNAIA